MKPTRYARIRIYHTLRSAHLERAHEFGPASIIYGGQRYDFEERLAAGLDLIPAGTCRMAGVLMRSRIAGLEVNEPLQRPGLIRTATAIAIVRSSALWRRRPVKVVTYAIENRDPFAGVKPVTWKARVRWRLDGVLARFVASQVDRIVFGTDSARELYGSVMREQLRNAVSITLPALPSPCNCAECHDRAKDSVIFLGALEAHKGFPELLAAWNRVVALRPSSQLCIIGKGSLESAARELAKRSTSVNLVIDPPRSDIHHALRSSAVLVLASQPAEKWREQVGLPIVEGLAHGCSIVTTDQTGLADWLTAHGHIVLPADQTTDGLALGIMDALRLRRKPESVIDDLPAIDGRLAADEWLFADID